MQLELFTADFHERPKLIALWRGELDRWLRDIFEYRHLRSSTGWSMATGRFFFARLLFRKGELTRAEYKRFLRFRRRVSRWDCRE
jgi:hypothetical protein